MSFTKDPSAVLDYGMDWSRWLGTDTIIASSWTVDAGLTVTDDTHDDTSTTVWLSGGGVGQRYNATNRITTTAGRIDERTLSITVRDR